MPVFVTLVTPPLKQDGDTALHDLAFNAEPHSVRVAKFLLEHNASVKITNKEGVTPLMRASSPFGTRAMATLLVEHEDTNARLINKKNYVSSEAEGGMLGRISRLDPSHRNAKLR